jgi:hypothetical protein
MPAARVSQQYVEIVSTGTADKARLSQQYVEVPSKGTADKARLSQQYVEVPSKGTANAVRLSQQYVETVTIVGVAPGINNRYLPQFYFGMVGGWR